MAFRAPRAERHRSRAESLTASWSSAQLRKGALSAPLSSFAAPILDSQPSTARMKKTPSTGHSKRKLGYSLLERAHKRSFVALAKENFPSIGDKYDWLLTKLDEFSEYEEPHRTGALSNFITSVPFQAFFAIVILANACWMAYSLNLKLQSVSKDGGCQGWCEWTFWVDFCFLLLYLVELLCKLAVHLLE